MTGIETDEYDWFSADMATLGDRITAARDAARMTQADLAKRVAVKKTTIRAWEEDLSEPRAAKLSMLAGLLNVSITWLLTGEGEGAESPDDSSELSHDLAALLTELRSLREDMRRGADRAARLEKRLKALLEQERA